jgi:Zn-dependent M28 family amino/carboxypeptidase
MGVLAAHGSPKPNSNVQIPMRALPLLLSTLISAAIAPALLAQARDTAAPAGPALEEITERRLEADIQFLAHDLLEGRAPSTRGGQLAAEYIAARFAQVGLSPGASDGTFFQQVTILESKVSPGFSLTIAGGSGAPDTLAYLSDVVAFAGVEQPKVSVDAELVFVGYGINAPEQRWNDYAGIDVKGKIVVAVVNDPPAPATEPALFGGPALTYYGRWTYKFEEAARQGAAGALLIHTTESASYPWTVVQSSWSGTQYSLPVPPGAPTLPLKAWITEDAARKIMARAGKDLDALREAASSRGFKAVPLGVTASAVLTQEQQRKTSPNVIGVLKGTNASEAVVYTAHYDHFGIRERRAGQSESDDRIYNGAIDNATGVAGIISIASAFARADTPPGRSIYFVSTTAEESGLLGAEYFASNPPLPMSAIAANINVDGLNNVGPASDMVLLGAERSTLGDVARDLLGEAGRTLGTDPEPGHGYFFRSDHFPLAKAGVPAVSISDSTQFIGKDEGFARRMREEYTDKRYHQPSDEFDPAWDMSGAVADLKLLTRLGWHVAALPEMPAYHAGEQFAQPRLRKPN